MKDQDGSVSVVVAAVILITLVLSLGVADVARVLVARSHARTAADAAALAVAQELLLPTGADLVEIAVRYATLNGAGLTRCDCLVGTYEATVAVAIVVDGFLLISGSRSVSALSRAVVDLPVTSPSPSPGITAT